MSSPGDKPGAMATDEVLLSLAAFQLRPIILGAPPGQYGPNRSAGSVRRAVPILDGQ